MPKRQLDEDLPPKLDEELETDWTESKTKPATDIIKKNSLDSDEEDDGKDTNYNILPEDEIEGQEEGMTAIDDEVQITPFNMKEELEEGHFDTEGNYHWNKEKVVRDNWLENIDWVKIKKPEEGEGEESDSDESVGIVAPFDHIPIYRQILEMMKPGETVARALRRLAGNKTLTASERWKRKKAGEDVDNSTNQQLVTTLTEYANNLLTKTGNMDIYQESYEHISLTIKHAEKNSVASLLSAAGGNADDLDMYADDFDSKEKARVSEPPPKKVRLEVGEGSKQSAGEEGEEDASGEDKTLEKDTELTWEFMWEKASAEVYGPHTSAEMQAWADEGYFKKQVWACKCGLGGEFHPAQRIDFELSI